MSVGGLSNSRLERMHRILSGHVERQHVPGLVFLVARGEDVHAEAIGTMAFGQPAPMRRDSIFRVASIVKPVTAAAAMMLVEDCRLRLDDSIEPWLPELAERRVLKSIASELDDTVPAQRAISVRDLLTSRMGFGSVMAMPDTYPIQRAIRELRIGGDGPPKPALQPRTEQWLRNLGSLPLMAQPGERWMYNVSSDVLGILIERVSGQTFGAFLRERLFDPLGMKDTGFFVPEPHIQRLPPCYAFDYQAQAVTVFDGVADSAWNAPPPLESGAGGLVSTIDDYFAFSRMLLNHGRHGREQLLSPATVSLMTSDQLDANHRIGAELFFGTHSSWGLGMAVGIGRNEIFQSPGRFGWDGGFGTSAYTDPGNDLIGLLYTQRLMDSPEPPKLYTDFWTCAYAAIE
ncbi:MAG: serine hydrolase domain-containing protein [Lysobacter sp.]